MGVDPDRLLLTNGGAEAIALVAAELGGRVDEPAFGLHPRGRGGPLWRSIRTVRADCWPRPDETADVWDEAFFPLATGRWTRGDGRVVVGSLTKLLGLPRTAPRLRARRAGPGGPLPGPPAAVVGGRPGARRRCPTSSPPSICPAGAPGWRSSGARWSVCWRSHGLTVRPSDANWVLVDRGGLREALAPHGVVVRDCASFGLPGVTRIAVPSAQGLDRWPPPSYRVSACPRRRSPSRELAAAGPARRRRLLGAGAAGGAACLGLRRCGPGRLLRGDARSPRHPTVPARRPRARRAGAHPHRRARGSVGRPLPAVALRRRPRRRDP